MDKRSIHSGHILALLSMSSIQSCSRHLPVRTNTWPIPRKARNFLKRCCPYYREWFPALDRKRSRKTVKPAASNSAAWSASWPENPRGICYVWQKTIMWIIDEGTTASGKSLSANISSSSVLTLLIKLPLFFLFRSSDFGTNSYFTGWPSLNEISMNCF